MLNELKYVSYLFTYTIFYYGLYYCPPINNKFNKLILYFHKKW